MSEKSLSEIITGIKDCLMVKFGPHLSLVPPTGDGRTLAEYLEALAMHFVPAVEKLILSASSRDPHDEHRSAIEELRAEIAELKGQKPAVAREMIKPASMDILRFFGRRKPPVILSPKKEST